MKKLTIATLTLLLCAVLAIAQQNYPSSQTTSPSSSGETTIQGCLSRSDGGYTLTDKSGTTYMLTGDTARLSDYVGHEVQITGATTEPTPRPGAPSATTGATAQPTLHMTSLKHISETCRSKSKPETENPPMSEKPPTPR